MSGMTPESDCTGGVLVFGLNCQDDLSTAINLANLAKQGPRVIVVMDDTVATDATVEFVSARLFGKSDMMMSYVIESLAEACYVAPLLDREYPDWQLLSRHNVGPIRLRRALVRKPRTFKLPDRTDRIVNKRKTYLRSLV